MNNVYVTDLDGTLLDEHGKLSKVSREILNGLIARGVKFTIASARSIDSIRAVIQDMPLSMPVIEFNGSYITDYHTGEKLHVNCIDQSLNRGIYELIQSHDLSMIVTCHENEHDYLHYNYSSLSDGALEYVNYRKDSGSERLVDHRDLQTVVDSNIICFNVIDEEEKIKSIHNTLIDTYGDQLEVHMMQGTYSEKWFWLNVADPKGTKGQALKIFKELYLSNEDCLYVFGDNNNDIGMFEVADVPVALENSVDILKEMADVTIGYNYEDSVAKYVHKKAGEWVEKN
jgi:hypothetical protein